DRIIELTLLNPHNTSIQVMKLLKQENITVSISTIQTIWKREKLNTREMRIKQSQSMNIDV
ncbi:ISNCY family transposase, partial [Vibrio sp. 10N.222.52.B7]